MHNLKIIDDNLLLFLLICLMVKRMVVLQPVPSRPQSPVNVAPLGRYSSMVSWLIPLGRYSSMVSWLIPSNIHVSDDK